MSRATPNTRVINYYHTKGSKYGYKFILGGTKHFGYYDQGDNPWNFNQAMRKMEALLLRKLDLKNHSKILDAGCGVGDVASYVVQKSNSQVTGVDLLEFNIEEAQRRGEARGISTKLDFHCGDYTTFVKSDNYFDAIYTMETMVHVKNTQKALDKFYKILKPNGKLVMFEYSYAGKDGMPGAAYSALTRVNRLAAMPGFQKFTHGKLESLLNERGYVAVESEDISENILPMLKAFSIMAYLPCKAASFFNPNHKMANVMSAVEFYKYRDYIHYNVISARKPR